jgi:hypothetical protein
MSKFFFVYLIMATGLPAQSAAHFTMPDYETFQLQLPHYKYICDIEQFYSDEEFRTYFGVLTVPTNAEFNARLSETMPRILYTGIQNIAAANPDYAKTIYDNAIETPMRFVCSNFGLSFGAGALSHRQYWIAGPPTIDLGFATIGLSERKLDHGPRQAEFDSIETRMVIFHEMLHFLGGPTGKILLHEPNFFSAGGEGDVVYSCANLAFAMPFVSDTQPYMVALRSYPVSSLLKQYANYRPQCRENRLAEKIINQMNPRTLELSVFTREQCMTCATVELTNDRIQTSENSDHVARANNYCDGHALRLTRDFAHDSSWLEYKAELTHEINDLTRQVENNEPSLWCLGQLP